MKFYKCEMCGNLVEMIKDANVPMSCCGQQMTELKPGISDGAHEKHVPVYKTDCNKVVVNVGTTDHPMLETHYIEWIAVETDKGVYRKTLKPECAPKAKFLLKDDEKVVGVYAYCNLHGLWKAE